VRGETQDHNAVTPTDPSRRMTTRDIKSRIRPHVSPAPGRPHKKLHDDIPWWCRTHPLNRPYLSCPPPTPFRSATSSPIMTHTDFPPFLGEWNSPLPSHPEPDPTTLVRSCENPREFHPRRACIILRKWCTRYFPLSGLGGRMRRVRWGE